MARAIAITSGKGGVGKTNAATNIGVALARLGRRVCIFDADLGLANVNVLTGQAAQFTIEHLLDGACTLEQLILEGPGGVRIVPAGSGVEKLANLSAAKLVHLRAALEELEKSHDFLLIDTAAGIGPNVLHFLRASHEAVVVISPDPTSMTDSYALLKVLHRQGFDRDVSVLVNMAAGEEEAAKLFSSLDGAVRRFLGRQIRYLGFVVRDYALASSVLKQTPVTILYPESAASRCFERIAATLDARSRAPQGVPFSDTWLHALAAEKSPAEVVVAPTPAKDAPPAAKALAELRAAFESPDMDEGAARELLTELENVFVRRFGKPFFDLRAGLFQHLDFADVSSAAIKEAALLLDSIHERRYGAPIFEIEELMLKALAHCDSESRMQRVFSTLETGFARRFGKRHQEIEESLTRAADNGGMTSERMKGLLELLDAIHREKFGNPLCRLDAVDRSEVEGLLHRLKASDQSERKLEELFDLFRAERKTLERQLEELAHGGATLKQDD